MTGLSGRAEERRLFLENERDTKEDSGHVTFPGEETLMRTQPEAARTVLLFTF